jgi:uroporphyrinogen decarboxylase
MKDELTPRERVLLAVSHQEPDRVPVDFLATAEAMGRLQQYLGIDEEEGVLSHLGIDVRHPRQPYRGPSIRRLEDGSWMDPWGVRRQSVPHEGGFYEEIVEHPLADLTDPADLSSYPWPQPEWWDANGLREQIEQLDSKESYAIALEEFGDPGGIFEVSWYMRGMEQFLIDMIETPDIPYEIMSKVTDFYLGMLEQVMAASGDRVDLIWTSDDIAHQHGPLISKTIWKELIAPHHERFNQRVHELGTRVMYHSCGAVRTFIPDLIENGVDVLDVLQFSADNMDPIEIKQSFGDRLSFHGGMDVQSLLPFATVDEIRRTAKDLMEALGKNGGYILSPTHNIQVDTPPENIVAMYEEAGSLVR